MLHREETTIKISVFQDPSSDLLPVIIDAKYTPCTLLDIRQKYASHLPEAELTLNGRIYPNDRLVTTWVRVGSEIIIKPYPGLWIFSLYFVVYAIQYFAVAYALNYLGGLLFGTGPPAAPEYGTLNQSFGWDPRTTQREGIAVPLAYGKNMHHGNIVSRWTSVDASENEILYMKICYGEGPVEGVDLDKIYINNQTSDHYDDVTIQDRKGTNLQTAMTGFETEKIEIRTSNEITHDGGAVTYDLPRKGFDEIEFTLGFDRGIYYFDDSGDQEWTNIDVKVDIAVKGSGSWTTLIDTFIRKNQLEPYYVSYSTTESALGFTPDRTKQYSLRVTKESADQSKCRFGDEVRLRSYRGVVNTAFTHPGKVLLGLVVRASNLLSGSIDVKCVREDKILRRYNGTSWTLEYNNNRAWVAWNMLTQPVITGDGSGTPWAVEAYEGFQPSSLDTAFFYDWALLCDNKVDDGNSGTISVSPCSHILDAAAELWSTIYNIAVIGRANLTWEGTTLSGWLDTTVTGDLEIITSDIIIDGSWTQEWMTSPNKAGTINVTYQDEDRGYKVIKWPYSNEDSGNYSNTINVLGIGIKNRALATFVAAFTLKRNQLVLEINECVMYKDALMYKLGEVFNVQVTQPNWGESYRIEDSDSSTGVDITLDRIVTATAGEELYIRSYVPGSGAVTTTKYTIDSVASKVVTLTTGLTDAVSRKDIVAVGSTTELKKRRLISKTWNPDHTFSMVFEQYDASLFDIFSTTPTVDYPDYTPATSDNKLADPISGFDVQTIIKNAAVPQASMDIPWTSNLTWAHTGSAGTASWAATNVANDILFRLKGTTYSITADNTTKEFIYWDPNFTTTFRDTDDIDVAIAANNWLMAVNDGDAIHPANGVQLMHAGVLLAGTIRTDKIIAKAITTETINDEAVTTIISGFTSASQDLAAFPSFVTVADADITTTGGNVEIWAAFFLNSTAYYTYVRLYRNDGVSDTLILELKPSGWLIGNIQITFPYVDIAPSIGTYNYSLQVTSEGGSGAKALNSRIFLRETRK